MFAVAKIDSLHNQQEETTNNIISGNAPTENTHTQKEEEADFRQCTASNTSNTYPNSAAHEKPPGEKKKTKLRPTGASLLRIQFHGVVLQLVAPSASDSKAARSSHLARLARPREEKAWGPWFTRESGAEKFRGVCVCENVWGPSSGLPS